MLSVVLAAVIAVAGAPVSETRATLAPIVDVSLSDEGYLIGQAVSDAGRPLVDADVRLHTADGRFAQTKTDTLGGFAFKGASGRAELHGPGCVQGVRVWAPRTAPPAATPALLLVEGSTVVRGQHRPSPAVENFVAQGKRLMANPLFVAGAVATAVAIPVAIHNADDDDPASP